MIWPYAKRVSAVVALLAVVLAGGCSADRPSQGTPTGGPPNGGGGGQFRPGPDGIGDPYFPAYGNGGYDVKHYTIKIKYNPSTDKLTGAVTVEANTTAPLSSFNLDFSGLTVRSVRVDGAAATHERQGQELVITPKTGLREGTAFTTEIAYDGQPDPLTRPGLGSTGFLHTPDGAFAIGQPESATTWFPVNDHPLDKATYRIEITAPEKLAALSNGVLTGTKKHALAGGGGKSDAWTTSTWEVHQPMASYLATVAIGKYRVKTGSHKGKPVVTAVAESLAEGAPDEAMARTDEVADFLETQFGPYPFEAYGGIVIDDNRIGFALETQTRPVYSSNFFVTRDGQPRDATWVVAHELAHQWYGDSVSVRHWRDIWLNEGFATYAQWLWGEHDGDGTAQSQFDTEYAGADDGVWKIAPADPGVGQIFSRSVYRRGAMAVHALRVAVGDEAFFRIIKAWPAEKRNGNATTSEFITLAERVSGKSLRRLFDAWLYGKTRPPRPSRL